MSLGVIQQQGSPRLLYEQPANEFVRDFVGKTLLLKGTVQASNPSGQLAVTIDGAPKCVVSGRSYQPDALEVGRDVYLGVRPEDVDLAPAGRSEVPPGVISATVEAALFLGERIEYQLRAEGQRAMLFYGPRHEPVDEGGKVWLKPRPDGHSVWPSDWAGSEGEAESS
jgi:ABC-type Fe3+/spermidine/putrescine transport system ATPase subunit